MRKVATALIWMCQPSHPTCIVHILGEEDKKKVTILDPSPQSKRGLL